MSARFNLLSRGNSKLGEGIHTWSIPAVDTCPGRTALCQTHCYATTGRFRTRMMDAILRDNLEQTFEDDFEDRIVREVRRRGVSTLRVHVSGDFYDPDYAWKWLKIAGRCRRTTFYAYTRSWRCTDFDEVLTEMAVVRNFRLWFSVDAESGTPEVIPPGVKLAFLQTKADDDPGEVDVVFRTHGLRATPATRIGLSLICPTENGRPDNDETCTSCRRCYR